MLIWLLLLCGKGSATAEEKENEDLKSASILSSQSDDFHPCRFMSKGLCDLTLLQSDLHHVPPHFGDFTRPPLPPPREMLRGFQELLFLLGICFSQKVRTHSNTSSTWHACFEGLFRRLDFFPWYYHQVAD